MLSQWQQHLNLETYTLGSSMLVWYSLLFPGWPIWGLGRQERRDWLAPSQKYWPRVSFAIIPLQQIWDYVTIFNYYVKSTVCSLCILRTIVYILWTSSLIRLNLHSQESYRRKTCWSFIRNSLSHNEVNISHKFLM